MTPAADKNRVYFLWDSTSRILPTLYALPPQLQASRYWAPEFEELWSVECIAKSKYVASLMVDGAASNPPTQLLTSAMSHGKETPVLGEDITRLAQRIMDM
ncbi:hypothetical protein N0V93_000552 [Gnomoniopsis smithogilvyi]|uniref:Uncharacterized protein n=1 Tax=Gnomoniopsis smithogilvyi TaxID=1191159 RepID=A0A9W9D0T9_9PEZI|nr:hypothetical protein N0V93_000552 [Gnomoniopsis smithogilvyi]